jgi:tellurite resistance protein TehA-like permease
MGTGGTAAVLALNPTGSDALEPASRVLAAVLLAASALGFVVLMVRFLRQDSIPWGDMGSAVHGPAFATIPAAMQVLTTALILLLPESADPGIWWWACLTWNAAGALMSIGVTIRLFATAFVRDDFPVERMSGIWFIPETALLLSGMVAGRLALTGPSALGEALLISAFAFVGAGSVLFALTAAVYFNRLILHAHVSSSGAPTLWIMLSPLSVTSLALYQLGRDNEALRTYIGSVGPGAAQLLAMLLWGFSLWWFLAAALLTWRSRTGAVTYTPADWGYVFPSAALTLATLVLGRNWDSSLMVAIGGAFAVVLLAVWCLVGWTAMHARRPAPG